MLFVIKNLVDINDEKAIMLTELLLAHQNGKHYIWCNRGDFHILKKYFKDNKGLTPILSRLSSDVNEGKSIIEALNFYICLDFDDLNSDIYQYDKTSIGCCLNIYYKKLLKLESYGNKICFLSENLTDIEAYKFLADSYKNLTPSLKNLTLSLDAYNGGGSQTSVCFNANKSEKITLCIVDSDKRYHNAGIQKTARDVVKVQCEEHEISKVHVLDCHEVENLFHPKIWEIWHSLGPNNEGDIYRGIIFDEQWLNDVTLRRDFIRYIDYKKGLKSSEFETHIDRNFKSYWDTLLTEIECLKVQRTSEIIICTPLGDNALKSLVEYLNSNSDFRKKVLGILQNPNNAWYNLWEKYAHIITSWTIAPRKSSVS